MSDRLTDEQVRTTARVLEAAAARRAREAAAAPPEPDEDTEPPGVDNPRGAMYCLGCREGTAHPRTEEQP